jgi:hypothetical protein
MENKQLDKKEIKTIPRKLFFYVYLILPILTGLVLLDIFYFDFAMKPYLGIETILLPLFVFIFNLPHIVASFFSFLDKEYVQHYRKHLFLYLPLVLIATTLILFENYLLGLVIFLVSDIWHGVKQKVGIALILGARPGFLHTAWTWIAFVTSAVAFVFIIRPSAFPDAVLPYISPTLFIGTVLILLSMLLMIWKSVPKVRWYIFAVSMLFLLSYFFILAGYVFFAILAFRFVHDVSAFAFYATHDINRAKDGNKNWLYSLFSSVPLPVLILTPMLGLLFAYATRVLTDGIAIGYTIVILLSMSHYYLEAVMWRRGSPHRNNIKVV